MGRLIDADALNDALLAAEFESDADWALATKYVDDAPTINAEPVRRGTWLTWEEQFPGAKAPRKNRLGVFCSECHMHADNESKRCPECGAKMDGGATDEY